MPLTLVTGPAASGKSARLVDIAAAHYEADRFASTLVLVPTVRHADQFRRRLVSRVGVAFGCDVTTIGLFAVRHAAGATVPAEVAQELLARTTRERAAGRGPASRFQPIAHTPGLGMLVASAVSDLVADAVGPTAFRAAADASGDADLRALAEIYEAYRSALDARGWRDPREAARIAAEALRAATSPAPLAPLVLVDGMQFLRGGEVDLVAAIAARAETWMTLDAAAGARAEWTRDALAAALPDARLETLEAPPADVPLTASTAADAEAQLREVARAIKQQLEDDRALRPSDFAVMYRQVTPHLALARRVFEEARLPLDAAAGERLAERPFGAWLLQLLRLGVHGWRTREVADALTAGFVSDALRGTSAADLGRVRRVARASRLWSGLDALRDLPRAVERDLEAHDRWEPERLRAAASAWGAAIEALGSTLDPQASRTPGEHAHVLEEALFGARAWLRAEDADYPTLGVETRALRAELQSMRAVDAALPGHPVTFEAFVALLEARMQRPSTLIREAGGVLLAPMHTLHGLRFAHVHLAGLSEGEFPAPRRAGALLDGEAREALRAAGLDLPPEPRASEHELWRTASTRAAQGLSLWRPRLDAAGRPAAASYYFAAAGVAVHDIEAAPRIERAASTRELAIALVGGWPRETRRPASLPAWERVVRVAAPVEQRRRSFYDAGPYEGALAGVDLGALLDPARVWSATRLESYRTCAFQFFGASVLRLSEVDEEQEQADAATRGTVMHDMLDAAIAPLAARGAGLDASTMDEVIAHLRGPGAATWDAAPATYAFGRAALWRYERDRALDDLEGMVRREVLLNETFGVTTVVGGERTLEATLPGATPMRIGGRVDRVDSGTGVVQVVDYKTGRAIPRGQIDSGDRLQLQVYALAAHAQFGDVRLIARYAFLRPEQRDWWLDSDRPADAAVLEEAAQHVAQVRADVERGTFHVAPRVAKCPTYCAFIHACRVSPFSRDKTWR